MESNQCKKRTQFGCCWPRFRTERSRDAGDYRAYDTSTACRVRGNKGCQDKVGAGDRIAEGERITPETPNEIVSYSHSESRCCYGARKQKRSKNEPNRRIAVADKDLAGGQGFRKCEDGDGNDRAHSHRHRLRDQSDNGRGEDRGQMTL